MTDNGKVAVRKGQAPAAIISLALNKGINPEDLTKLEKMMELQARWEANEARKAFSSAMVRVQNRIPVVWKGEKNLQTGSKYAAYEDIIKACQPIYTEEGFSVTFYQGCGTPEDPLTPEHIRVVAEVMHDGGHTKIVHADIPAETTGPQGKAVMTKTHATGSAFSYGRSYLMRLIFNIPTGDDDDGQAAGKKDYITEQQLSTITDMINAKNVDLKAFLAYMRVEATDKIEAKDFNKAMASLRAARGKQ